MQILPMLTQLVTQHPETLFTNSPPSPSGKSWTAICQARGDGHKFLQVRFFLLDISDVIIDNKRSQCSLKEQARLFIFKTSAEDSGLELCSLLSSATMFHGKQWQVHSGEFGL